MPGDASDRYRLIVDSATSYAIVTLDGELKITTWNKGATRLFGWNPVEAVGLDFREIFTPEDRAAGADRQEADTAIRTGRSEDNRWHVRKDGSRFWGAGELMQLKGAEPGALLKIVRDETNRKRLEDDHALLLEELRRADLAKDHLLAMISHELRTPLTIMLGNATWLVERSGTWDEAARHEAMRELQREISHLEQLVEDMLVLARIAPGHSIELEPVLLQRELASVIGDHRRLFPFRRIVLDVPPDLPPVRGQPTYIAQILRNLLSNSEKYSFPDQPITIKAKLEGDRVVVRYEDVGPQVHEDVIDHLGEPFFRVSRTGKGLGLGLAVCRRLAEAQAGALVIDAREEGGLSIDFTLLCERASEE